MIISCRRSWSGRIFYYYAGQYVFDLHTEIILPYNGEYRHELQHHDVLCATPDDVIV